MNKISVISLIVFLSYNISSAQITFQRTYGGNGPYSDVPGAVIQSNDGGYIIVGYTESFGAGMWDVYLVKTDSIGDTLWTKTYGGSDRDIGYSVQQTNDGGYIVVGATEIFDIFAGEVLLIKTDANGDTLWTRTYGGNSRDEGYAVQQTADSGYIITGKTASYGAGIHDVYLIKTDVSGDTLWTRTYGGLDFDIGYSVQQTSDGGYVVAGTTNSFGPWSGNVYLVKTDSIGDTLWTRVYGGSDADEGYCVQQTSDSGYIITGRTKSFGAGGEDVYLIKTNANGDTLWTRTYGGLDFDIGYSVQQTFDDGYVIAGYNSNNGTGVYLIRTNASGDTLWTKTYGDGAEIGFAMSKTSDNGYIIAGSTSSFGGGTGGNYYLIKTDSIGNSGCKESGTNTIVGNTATVVSSTATIVGSGAVVSNTATIVGNTTTVTTDVCDTTIGINEQLTISNEQITIYPNPAKEIINIKGNFDVPATIVLYDLTGRKVLSQHITSNQPINISTLSKGLYVWQIKTPDVSARGKFIKQ